MNERIKKLREIIREEGCDHTQCVRFCCLHNPLSGHYENAFCLLFTMHHCETINISEFRELSYEYAQKILLRELVKELL